MIIFLVLENIYLMTGHSLRRCILIIEYSDKIIHYYQNWHIQYVILAIIIIIIIVINSN